MTPLGLISVCLSAFIAVFVILSILAIMMRFIIILFPFQETEKDSALFAALFSAINKIYPGTKITKIEELK